MSPPRRWVRLAATLALGLLLTVGLVPVAAGSAGAQELVTSGTYLERLERAIGLAEEPAETAEVPGRLREIRVTLGLPLVVQTPEGPVEIPPDPLLDRATGLEGLAEVARHLRATLEQARGHAAAPVTDREALDAELRAAYAAVRGEEGLVDRIRRRALELLGNLLFRLFAYRGIGTVGAWLLVAASVAGVVWLVRRLAFGVVPEHRATGSARVSSPMDWRRLADDALARSDLEEAVRCRYHALLAELAHRAVVRDDPSLTAGEARRAVGRTLPELYPPVADATTAFERVAYGREAANPEDVETLRRAERAAAL